MEARRAVLIAIAGAVLVTAITPFLGGVPLDYGNIAARREPDWNILATLRIPRALLAFLAGAALSASGAIFQALLRDALATPSNLGVSAAAALGAVAAISFGPGDEVTGLPIVWLSALAGTAAVVALVALLRRNPRFSTLSLLLTGIAVNGICASLVLLLNSLAGIAKTFQITHWLMGGIEAVDYPVLAVLAAAIVPCLLWTLRMARVWNVVSFGDAWAAGRGIDIHRVTWQGFAAGAVLTGLVTAVTGPIAFVGLIVPHLVRRIAGPDYRVLLPVSIFAGGAFLVVCDTLARTVLAPVEIPVGVITALLGGPFFVWLLWSR